MKVVGIYKLTTPSNKSYIGQSVNIENRWSEHEYTSLTSNTKLYKSIRKHGWNNIKKDIIQECKVEELDKLEKFYIKKYDSVENGLNLTYGGEGGRKSDETKSKISKSMVGKNNWSTGGHHKKPVLQYSLDGEFIYKWDSAVDACAKLNITTIPHAAANKCKSSAGFIWIYEKDFLPSLLKEKVLKVNKHGNKDQPKSQQHKSKIRKSQLERYAKQIPITR